MIVSIRDALNGANSHSPRSGHSVRLVRSGCITGVHDIDTVYSIA